MSEGFWQVNIGHLLTILTILLSAIGLYGSRMGKIQKDSEAQEEIRAKVNIMYRWFEEHIMTNNHTRGQEGTD